MLRYESKQSSFHCLLYNKIPEKHILKQVKNVIDFSFVNSLLEDTYCKNFGRPAKELELMCKLLFLQSIYNLSDEKLIEEANLNLAYLYFLDINPEDSLPEKSLLSKFRTRRLGEKTLDEIIIEMKTQRGRFFCAVSHAKFAIMHQRCFGCPFQLGNRQPFILTDFYYLITLFFFNSLCFNKSLPAIILMLSLVSRSFDHVFTLSSRACLLPESNLNIPNYFRNS